MHTDSQVEETLFPTLSNNHRYRYSGMYDRSQMRGLEIVGEGPNFDSAMNKFYDRQLEMGRRGKWRHDSATWKTNDGRIIDKDYEIQEWM